jgi:translation initiation factor 2 alpha subunit (eIF-2alpha)
METQLKKIDEAANNYNKTKDPQYKDLWYKLIREWNNGTNNFKRRAVSINSCVKSNDGTYTFIGTFSDNVHGPVRNTTTKVDGVRRFYKFTHNE